MKINIYQLIEGAKKAKGLAVVIDVFRAFSLACYVKNNNAERIIPVGDIDLAYELKKENPDYILMGERGGLIQPGFDFGNSPFMVKDVDFTNKTIVHTTSAGTQGIANATGADEIITASFVNISSVINYIKKQNPSELSLLCMGDAGVSESAEDTYCAEYIKAALENREYLSIKEIREKLKNGVGRKFFRKETQNNMPSGDFEMCLDIDKFDFILKCRHINNKLICLERINP